MKLKSTQFLLLFVIIMFTNHAWGAGSQPGRWQWKSGDGTTALALVGQPITIHHVQDVISLRWQIQSGTHYWKWRILVLTVF